VVKKKRKRMRDLVQGDPTAVPMACPDDRHFFRSHPQSAQDGRTEVVLGHR